jgi:hypothetical protein
MRWILFLTADASYSLIPVLILNKRRWHRAAVPHGASFQHFKQ